MLKEIRGSDFSDYQMNLVGSKQFAKTAQEVFEEARKLLDTLQPNERVFYVHVVALGAGEYWGPNRNGDYFPEEELKKTYKTFLDGHVFRLHENKDPAKAMGRVIGAFWNDRMKRVELVLEMDREKAADILHRLENGETVDVSMGCKVDFDICSICGHKSKSRAEYCEHLKNDMGKILPDGRRVYAINPNPKFFDISFVRRGADPTAKVLVKVAEDVEEQQELRRLLKKGSMNKQIPAESVSLIDNITRNSLIARARTLMRERIPTKLLDFLMDKLSPNELLANSIFSGITFKPEELEHIFSRFYVNEPKQIIRLIKISPISERKIKFIKKHLGPFETEEGTVDIDIAIKIEKTAQERVAEAGIALAMSDKYKAFLVLLSLLAPLLEQELIGREEPKIPNQLQISPRNLALLKQHGNIPAGMLLTLYNLH